MWEGRAATAVTACSLPRQVRGGIRAIRRSMGAHSRKAAIRDRVETKLLLKLDGKETTAHPHPVDVQPHLQENSAPTIDLSLQQNQFFYLFFFREMSQLLPVIISKVGGRWYTSKQWTKNNVGTGMLHQKISSPTHGRQSQWSGRQFFSTILSSPSHLDWNHVN